MAHQVLVKDRVENEKQRKRVEKEEEVAKKKRATVVKKETTDTQNAKTKAYNDACPFRRSKIMEPCVHIALSSMQSILINENG
tara:strand:+ start:160 stop:408 length:249 start_codon:yes stop_codon:yes gene_type:complete